MLIELSHITQDHFRQVLSEDAELLETLHLTGRQIEHQLVDNIVKNYVNFRMFRWDGLGPMLNLHFFRDLLDVLHPQSLAKAPFLKSDCEDFLLDEGHLLAKFELLDQ